MVSQHGIKLASYLISSYYGESCSKVCECLLRRGTLTFPQIIRFTELKRDTVRDCLLILIHHNCVQAFAIQQEGAFGEAPKILTQYMALFDNVIHKLRAPKFMQIVSEELGKDCLEIFEGLLQHGRLSLNQIIDRNDQASDGSAVQAVRESFARLVNARFVERCPAPEPFLAPPAEEDAPKKKSAKSAKIAEETVEQRALEAAAVMDSMRFLIDMDAWADDAEKKDDDTSKSVTVGQKRKLDVASSDGELLDSGGKKEILWRVNFEVFVRRLRHKALIANVRARLNDEAAIVLRAILDLTRGSETRLKTETTAPVSVDAIYDEVIKKDGGLGMDLERIRASLVHLGCEIQFAVDEYSVDLKKIIEHAQNEEVESVVLKRYGREAYRMFRLLSKAGRFLETDKISDTTFVEKKDSIKILYKLWKDDYLQMEKVTISGARQMLLLLWKVNHQSIFHLILDEMYHAALNLRLRITHEQDQEKELLLLPREKLVGELKKRYVRLGKVRVILESSLMNLDDAIMLFHDF